MKHNKKRNTMFLYEVLVRNLTNSVLEKDKEKQIKILSILKEFFNNESVLYQERELYKEVLGLSNFSRNEAEKLFEEIRRIYWSLDPKKIFDEQTKVVDKVNKEISKSAWQIFVPNYRSLATINQILKPGLKFKQRVLLESALLDELTEQKDAKQEIPADDIIYNTFVRKFNEKYGSALTEQQKKLIYCYVSTVNSPSIETKIFLNEEIGRLKIIIDKGLQLESVKESQETTENLQKLNKILSECRERDVDQDFLRQILEIQEIAREIEKDE